MEVGKFCFYYVTHYIHVIAYVFRNETVISQFEESNISMITHEGDKTVNV